MLLPTSCQLKGQIWDKFHILSLTDSLTPRWVEYFIRAFNRHHFSQDAFLLASRCHSLPRENQFDWAFRVNHPSSLEEHKRRMGWTGLPVRKHIPVSTQPIPKIIHQIWIGNKENPCQDWTELMREMNPELTYILHGNELIDRYKDDVLLKIQLKRGAGYSSITNRLRLLLLRDEGGMYVDVDVEPLKPLLPIFIENENSDLVASMRTQDGEQTFPDHDVLLSAPNGNGVGELLCVEQSIFTGPLLVEKLRGSRHVTWAPSEYWYSHEPSEDSYLVSEGRRMKSWSQGRNDLISCASVR